MKIIDKESVRILFLFYINFNFIIINHNDEHLVIKITSIFTIYTKE